MLHVNGGMGDTSYVNNSLLQREIISMTCSIAKEAITNFYHQNFPTSITIVDLGCSSGLNTLIVVSNLIKQVEEIRQKLHKKPLEYQIFLNDLHGNDFNAVFRILPSFLEDLKTHIGGDFGTCFFNGVPGSFYARLFPSETVHFFHSSSSLHWLSQVPMGIQNNKGNIYIGSTSPKSVAEAYYKQFQKDFSIFLKCRAEELVMGGHMVLTLVGRLSEDPSKSGAYYIWELLALALNTMVIEGIVEEKKADSFNVPFYMPSPKEVEAEVVKEGSFILNLLQVSSINLNVHKTELSSLIKSMADTDGYDFAKCMQSVAEPLLIHHFGESIAEELFCRHRKIVTDCMAREEIMECINLTISLTKIK
ncbi:S-adenosyl-L-methionine:benzoic acid/salicylic acid carboxyl methyltransferase 3-like [Benincasa hispida]|uniref:S-adenosyl-L-methionine:benzoic acid/salicylic acid carboxyl methyltransferase 3-like n=1 Tax=Benincasa hispida TaxID=102211 RepID=UPI0018FF872F|nr:S-adenosyl-L-methionine:benzoic acid/salicylic acid carboxyl methyltransferase 3-like [Benincasa hispida]